MTPNLLGSLQCSASAVLELSCAASFDRWMRFEMVPRFGPYGDRTPPPDALEVRRLPASAAAAAFVAVTTVGGQMGYSALVTFTPVEARRTRVDMWLPSSTLDLAHAWCGGSARVTADLRRFKESVAVRTSVGRRQWGETGGFQPRTTTRTLAPG